METNGEGTSNVEEDASVVEVGVEPEKPTAKAKIPKKASVRRKKPTAKKQRPNKVAEPVAREPAPLTTDEIRATLTDVKTQVVEVGLAPVTAALSSWSETLRDTVSGALAGLLGGKKRDGN
jgi:hypothetical protein